jgi:hypothetical protein
MTRHHKPGRPRGSGWRPPRPGYAGARRDLGAKYNIAKFRRLNYSEEEMSGGGSDRIVDDLVFWGDLDTIVDKLHAHVKAGADHVCAQVIGIEPGQPAMPYWRMLGDALLSQGVSA